MSTRLLITLESKTICEALTERFAILAKLTHEILRHLSILFAACVLTGLFESLLSEVRIDLNF